MNLLTKEITNKLPDLDTETTDDSRVFVHYFNPSGAGDWYGMTYDPQQRLYFGYVNLFDGELGYFSLDELESVKGPFGLGIERDRMWDDKTTLAQVKRR